MKQWTIVALVAVCIAVLAGCGAKEKIETGGNSSSASTGAGGGGADQAPDEPAGGGEDSVSGNKGEEPEGEPKSWAEMPEMAIDTAKTYTARFKTSKGDFSVQLYAKEAPQTVNSFVFLANEKFYDGVKFHRIIETFMIQTGDPLGNGTGGPGYNIPDELDNGFEYEEGIVAMANTGRPDSGGSQFFICTGADSKNLNSMPNYTIFGHVSEGMDVVKSIAQSPVELNDAGTEVSEPVEDVTIETITIEAK